MGSETTVSVEVDRDAGAAYLRLSPRPVARTVEHSEDLFVDLDDLDMVVGVEVLDLNETVDLDELGERYHIHTEALRVLVQALTWVDRPSTAVVGSGEWPATGFGAVSPNDFATAC